MSTPIVCLGVHILDTIARPVREIPSAQNSSRIEQILHAPGGTAAGVAVDIAHLGFPVTTIGMVGDDEGGRFLRSMMTDRGVDTSGVTVSDAAQTASSVLLVDEDGNRPALHVRGVNALATWDQLDLTPLSTASVVHLGGVDAMSGLDDRQTLKLMRSWQSAGKTVTVDFQSASQHLRPGLLDIAAAADVFLPNDEQALGLTGCATVAEAAESLLKSGAGRVVITCGAEGIHYADREGTVLTEPAVPVQAVDTTGCGDSVDAAFVISLSAGLEITAALRLAVQAGAAVASGAGSLGALPHWADLCGRAGLANLAPKQPGRYQAATG